MKISDDLYDDLINIEIDEDVLDGISEVRIKDLALANIENNKTTNLRRVKSMKKRMLLVATLALASTAVFAQTLSHMATRFEGTIGYIESDITPLDIKVNSSDLVMTAAETVIGHTEALIVITLEDKNGRSFGEYDNISFADIIINSNVTINYGYTVDMTEDGKEIVLIIDVSAHEKINGKKMEVVITDLVDRYEHKELTGITLLDVQNSLEQGIPIVIGDAERETTITGLKYLSEEDVLNEAQFISEDAVGQIGEVIQINAISNNNIEERWGMWLDFIDTRTGEPIEIISGGSGLGSPKIEVEAQIKNDIDLEHIEIELTHRGITYLVEDIWEAHLDLDSGMDTISKQCDIAIDGVGTLKEINISKLGLDVYVESIVVDDIDDEQLVNSSKVIKDFLVHPNLSLRLKNGEMIEMEMYRSSAGPDYAYTGYRPVESNLGIAYNDTVINFIPVEEIESIYVDGVELLF
ncbi:MAG: hypothetical protein BEN19_04470 [Epulopiscium sp. Nuni2H_MBin003]|nr:MAG: hypothetical protein BEN19_04470 [Epulopiscium sp. Nuni2H_MBin003]